MPNPKKPNWPFLPPFLAVMVILLSAGCKKPEPVHGVTGNYYTLSAKVPDEAEHTSFAWEIVKIPDSSALDLSKLEVSKTGNEMTFQPDVAGEYQFQTYSYHPNGKKLSTDAHRFQISGAPLTEIAVISDTLKDTLNASPAPMTKIVEKPAIKKIVSASYKKSKISKPKLISSQKEKIPPAMKIPPASEGFTIQVSAKKTLQEAINTADSLIAMGLDAYVQKAVFPETDEIWFRVRIGTFQSRETAKEIAQEIASLINKSTWVDQIRIDF